jgi:uncharacterized membrane protein
MDWYYDAAKYLHIVFAITWLGGAVAMAFLGTRAERAKDREDFVRAVRAMMYLADRMFIPSALGALLTGLVAAWVAGFYWQEWIVIGLVGFAATFGLGIAVLSPSAKRVLAQADKEGASTDVVRQCARILRLVRFDMVMLFTVVFAMVFKPTLDDLEVLAGMAVVVVLGAVFFLGMSGGRRTATA